MRFGPEWIDIFKGFNTAGIPIIETICVCKSCRESTTPLHIFSKFVDEDIELAELGLPLYNEILLAEDRDSIK